MNRRVPERLIDLLRAEYGNHVDARHLTLLQRGKYSNADVYRFADGVRDLAVKEFYSRPFAVRTTVGRFLIGRETQALFGLQGKPGVPPEVCRLGPCALAMAFIEGETLVALYRDCNCKLRRTFFLELERQVEEMHRAGYVHLDLRNLRNIICGRDGLPHLLDFQACLHAARLPTVVRRLLEAADLSAVYKGWLKVCEETLDLERAAFLRAFRDTRRLWFMKGYWLNKSLRTLADPNRGSSSSWA